MYRSDIEIWMGEIGVNQTLYCCYGNNGKNKKAPGEEVQKTCARVCVCQVDKRVILRMDLVFHLVYVQNPVLITRCICARVSVFEIGGMLMNP